MASTTSTTPKLIDDLHFEHQLWLRQIEHSEEELELFIRRLEILSGRQDAANASLMEQFQNRFIRQRDVMDELKHAVRQHESNLTLSENSELELANEGLRLEHNSLSDRVYTFEKLYAELKMDFRDFTNQ